MALVDGCFHYHTLLMGHVFSDYVTESHRDRFVCSRVIGSGLLKRVVDVLLKRVVYLKLSWV